MEKIIRKQKEYTQKRITILFCSLVAFAMFSMVMLSTIHAQAAPTETSYKYYTSVQIHSGDTLWDISSDYITSEYTDMNEYMNEVCAINHISRDEIYAGQYIVVPYYAVK